MNGQDRETLGEFGRRIDRFEAGVEKRIDDLGGTVRWVIGLQVTQTLLLLGSVIGSIVLGAIQ